MQNRWQPEPCYCYKYYIMWTQSLTHYDLLVMFAHGSITVVIQSLRALRKSVQYLWRGNGICLYYLCSLLLHGLLCRSLKPNTGIEYHWTHVGLRPAFPQTGNRKCLCHAMCVHQSKWTSKYQLCVPQRNRLWAAWPLCLIRLRVYPWLFFFLSYLAVELFVKLS